MWGRQSRGKGFILLVFMVIFSLGNLGKVDTRLHIGGSDWDSESFLYIHVDDLLVDDYVTEALLGNEESAVTTIAVDGLTGIASEPQAVIESEDLDREVEVDISDKEEVQLPSAKAEEPTTSRPEEQRPTILVHKVQSGETLWDIAQSYGITVATILYANDISNPNRLKIGQELQILTVKGVLHQVATGESLWEIAQRYKVSIDEIAQANSISDPSRIQPNTKIVIPGATRVLARDALLVNGQLQKAFDWPAKGRISSPFGPRWGKMHNGIDIAVVTGTPIRAAADGRVTFAGWNGGYGILVIVDHGNGVETRYAHNSRLNVKVGQAVQRGQIVSYSGNTGVSTGPHLHFEIRHRNTPVNPQNYLR